MKTKYPGINNSKMRLSIVIPAWNEERRIGGTLEEFHKYFSEKKKEGKIGGFEIVVVINNTQDRTEEIVKKFSRAHREVRFLNFKQGGKGFAVIEGFKDALKRPSGLIGFVDADLATGPAAFYELVKNMGSYDAVVASRYLPGSVVNPRQSLQRVFVSRIFNIMIRTLFLINYRDTQCGAKLFKREAIKRIIKRLVITRWAFDVDLLYQLKRGGFRVLEYPTVWSDREYSKINFKKAGPMMLLAILRLRIVNSPFSRVMKIYDGLPEWLKIHHRVIA